MITRVKRAPPTPERVYAFFDPGTTGAVAIAVRRGADTRWTVHDLPMMGKGTRALLNGVELHELLTVRRVGHAVVERVHSMPRQGVAGVFKFGTVYGQILGLLQGMRVPYEYAEPGRWKVAMKLPGGPWKAEHARQKAIELFPALHPVLARKKDHNRAEALLIGHWWFTKLEGTSDD